MRQEYKRKMRKQMGRRYLAILCIIAIFCTSLPITTTQTQARAYTDWEVYETDTGDAIAAAYGNHTFVLLNDVGIFYTSEDALTWTQTGILPGVDGTKKYTYEKLQMKYLNDRFFVYGVNDIFLWSMDGKEWESISIGNGLVTAMTYGEGAWYVATDGADRNRYQDEGDTFSLWSSQDGESFTKLGTESDIKACNSLCFAQNKLIVTDPVSDTINTLQPDGTLLAKIDAHNVCYEHYYAESRYKSGMFLCFFEGYIWYSTDAITWNCYKMLYQFLRNSMGEWAEIRDNYYMLNKTSGELYEITPCYDQPPVFTYINCRMSYGYDIQKLVVCDDVLWGFGNNIAARMPMKFDAETIEWDDAEKTPTISDGSVSDGSISENVPALIYEEDYVRLTKDITFSEDYTLRGKKLYLDGHILTIQGDFTCGDTVIDTGQGKLYVAGNMIVDSQTKISGKLEVDGYLSIQGGSLDCEICDIVVHDDLRVYYYRYNYGLQMRHEEDHVSVSGYLGYNTDYYGLLTAGTIDAYGTVGLSAGFKSRGSHILRVWGDFSQSVIINDSNCEVANYEDMRVDITPPEPVDSLLLKSATGKAIYLAWQKPKDDGKVVSYKVYRNGVCIKEVTETEVRIEEKYANEEAIYYITAVDEAGLESAKGKEITAKAEPLVFYKVLPENETIVGKTVTIVPYIDQTKKQKADHIRIYYCDPATDTETEVVKESLTKWKDNWFEGDYRYTKEYPIDLSKFKQEQDITVYAELTDIDGGVTTETITLHLDRTPPEQPAVTVVENEENIYLEWDKVADAKYYGIYRREKNTEIYKKLAERWWNNYYDSAVQDGKTYVYTVTAIDSFENESDKTEIPAVYKHPDTQAPVLKSFRVIGEEKHRETTTVRLYATDNRNVNRFVITGKRENDTENTIYEVVSGVNGYSKDVTIDTRKYEDGDYILTAYAEDRAGNKSDEKTAKLIIDNTPPAVPENLHAEVTFTAIKLIWDKQIEEDLNEYVIQEKKANGSFVTIDHISSNKTQMVINGLKPGQKKTYRMYAIDDVGNISDYSENITAETKEDMEKPSKVTARIVRNTGSSVMLSWTDAQDNVGVQKYNIYRDGILIAEEEKYLSYIDKEVQANQTYQYQVAAIDESGNEAEKSDIVTGTPQNPEIASVFPANNSMIGNLNTQIEVEILRPENPGNYRIECSYYKQDTDSWEEIGTAKLPGSTKTNSKVKIHWNTSNVEKDQSIPVLIKVYDDDNNCVQKRINLTVVQDETKPVINDIYPQSGTFNNRIILWMKASDNVAVGKGIFSYTTDGKNYVKLAEYEGDKEETVFRHEWDTTQLPAGEVTVRFEVYDTSENHNSLSDGITQIERQYVIDHTPPEKVKNIVVKDTNQCIGIAWDKAKAENVVNYKVYRKTGKSAEWEEFAITEFPYLYDKSIKFDRTYYYKVSAVDRLGNEGEASDIVQAIARDKNKNDEADLTWREQAVDEVIQSSEQVKGSLTFQEMTEEEIREAGLDFDSDKNKTITRFELTCWFESTDVPEKITYFSDNKNIRNSEGKTVSYISGSTTNREGEKIDYKIYPIGDGKTVACLSHTDSVSVLNDMYCLKLTIIGLENGGAIKDAKATVELPEYVTLAQTLSPQEETVKWGEIEPGGQAEKTWIVQASKPGTYTLQAEFNGMTANDQPVHQVFSVDCAFACNSMEGLHLYIRPEKTAYIGEEYYIQYELKNESDHAMYAVQTTFGNYKEAKAKTVTIYEINGQKVDEVETEGGAIYRLPDVTETQKAPMITAGDTVGTDILSAGASIYGTYVATFQGEGDRDKDYYKLTDSLVKILEGQNTGLQITVQEQEGHISKTRNNTIIEEKKPEYNESDTEDTGKSERKKYNPYTPHEKIEAGNPEEKETQRKDADPINLMTGAFVSDHTLMKVAGVQEIDFGIHYDSTDTLGKGDMGYGWYHDYETSITVSGDDLILHEKPGSSIRFESNRVRCNEVYGSYDEASKVISISENTLPDEEYSALTEYKGKIQRNQDGYELLCTDGSSYYYDVKGRLIRYINETGQEISLFHNGNQMYICDVATGKKLICEYTNGLLTTVTDPAGNQIKFTYDMMGNLLTETGKKGTVNHYTYDRLHRILTGTDTNGVLFVENTYDEVGRVLTQDDGDESTPLLTLNYEDDEETGRTKITYKKTDGGTEVILANSNGDAISYQDSIGGVTAYEYDSDGRLISYREADGTGTDYSRDEKGNVIRETATSGKTGVYSYNEQGKVLSYTDNCGTEEKWTYDAYGRIVTQIINGMQTNYTYDADGLLLTETVVGKGTKTYTRQDGNITDIAYPDESHDTFSYDVLGNVIQYKNRNGVQTDYEIDRAGNVTKETLHLSDDQCLEKSYVYDAYGKLTAETDAMGNTTTYEYDSHDNLIRCILANGSEISYQYDVNGNVICVTYPDGRTEEESVYDTAGNLKQVKNLLGFISRTEYGSGSQILKQIQADGGEIEYAYAENGLLTQKTDAEGNITSYTYDNAGRIIKICNPQGAETKITYDSCGNPAAVTDGEGNTVTTQYNAYGEITKIVDANGNCTSYMYDSMGNCVQTVDALGVKTSYTYDAMGNIISAVKGESRTGYTYDACDNLVKVTDAEDNSFQMEYDKAGNLTAVYDAYGTKVESYTYDSIYQQTGITDALGRTSSYTYDSMGNRIKEMNATGNITTFAYTGGNLLSQATDALGGNTSACYDRMGRLESFTNPNGGITSYRYDKNGQMIEEKTGDSYHITYSYDKAGNRKTVTNSRGQITEYEYDKAGRVIKQKDEAGEISYTYDANGNCLIISETVSENGVQNVSVNTITRTYDALNRVTGQTDADGNHIGYAYDMQGNLSVLTYPDGKELEYSYDKNGNVILVTDWENRETSFSYDKNGRLVRTERADGSTESRSYDKAGQLLQIKDTAKDGRLITDLSYSYNENGNIEQIRDKNAGTAGMESKTETMTYDAVNRLISYNGKAVSYDADGNMLYGPLNGQMASFTYDCRNRLIRTETDSGEVTKYLYDAENNRIGIIKNAGTEQESRTGYVVDSTSGELTQILQSRTEEAAKSADVGITTYLYAGNRLLAEDGEEYLTYHFNNVGSTTAVTDKSGNIKYRYAYSVYGELLKGNYGEVLFLYNGQYGVQSDDSGLYYMRARYYNAAIKRFINQDTVTGSIESSQSLNRYAYVEGNPISYLDPFGLEKTFLDETHQIINDFRLWLVGIEGTLLVATIAMPELAVATAPIMAGIGESLELLTIIDISAYSIQMCNAGDYNDEWFNALIGIAVNLLGTSASLEFKELFRGKNDYLKEGIMWIVERGEDKFESIIQEYSN